MNYGQAWNAILALVRGRRGEDFTTTDLGKYLAISRQSAHAWLRRFVTDGRLMSVGQGRSTRYRLAPYEPGRPRDGLSNVTHNTGPANTVVSVWGRGTSTTSDPRSLLRDPLDGEGTA